MSTRQCTIRILDEVFCSINGLRPEHYTFFYDAYAIPAPNYFFNPKFKLGVWDGRLRFFHKEGKTYINLLDEIIPSISRLGYKINIEDVRKDLQLEIEEIDKDFYKHINHAKTGEPTEFRPHQVEAVNIATENGGGIIIAGTGAGKDQPLTSKILTPTGWVQMGNIKLNDVVITPSGDYANVVGIFPQGMKDVYEIEFHDGSKTRCGYQHLWKVKKPKKPWRADTTDAIISTKDIIDFLSMKEAGDRHIPGNISIPLTQPIYYDTKELPIDPYLLGILIGDGCISKHLMLSSKDDQIITRVSVLLERFDVTLKRVETSNCDYRITKKNKQDTCPPSPNLLTEQLKKLGLFGTVSNNKFIPEMYKNASIDQRFALVQGLMDTDGTVAADGRSQSFCTVSEHLAKDMQEILWSLGCTCTITSRTPSYTYNGEKQQGQMAFDLHIGCSTPKRLFSLSRKQNRCREKHGDGRIELTRRVKTVTKVSHEQTQCIMIDHPDHLYITDDYVVTHNTLVCAALVDLYGRKNLRTLTIVPTQDLIYQTFTEYQHYQLDVGQYWSKIKDLNHTHVVSTWQSLQNNTNTVAQFQVVVVDECHGAKGNIIQKLLCDAGKHIPYRFGLTGTLPKEKADAMAVKCALGPVRYKIMSHELIEQKHLSDLKIEILQLEENFKKQYREFEDEHPGQLSYIKFKEAYLPDYHAEKAYLQKNQKRVDFIADLISVRRDEKKGNVFCLVDGVTFGKKLAAMIPNSHFVYGKDSSKVRREIYDLFKDNDNVVVIATVNIASTGLDIPRIFNLFLIDIGKSFVRVIQSIGRGLRKAHDKDFVVVTDVCSDLKYSKKHVRNRIKYYTEQKYPNSKKVIQYDTVDQNEKSE